jgi:hypothetical protein
MPVQTREWVWIAVYSLIAIVPQSLADVRFTPESGQIADISVCPSCADFVAKVVDGLRAE